MDIIVLIQPPGTKYVEGKHRNFLNHFIALFQASVVCHIQRGNHKSKSDVSRIFFPLEKVRRRGKF